MLCQGCIFLQELHHSMPAVGVGAGVGWWRDRQREGGQGSGEDTQIFAHLLFTHSPSIYGPPRRYQAPCLM